MSRIHLGNLYMNNPLLFWLSCKRGAYGLKVGLDLKNLKVAIKATGSSWVLAFLLSNVLLGLSRLIVGVYVFPTLLITANDGKSKQRMHNMVIWVTTSTVLDVTREKERTWVCHFHQPSIFMQLFPQTSTRHTKTISLWSRVICGSGCSENTCLHNQLF